MREIFILLIALSLIGCVVNEEEEVFIGEVSFNISNVTDKTVLASKNQDPNIPSCSNMLPKSVEIIILDDNNVQSIYELDLMFNESTKGIKLSAGTYNVISYIVKGEDGITPIWAAPEVGSYYQKLFQLNGVNPMEFKISAFNSTTVNVNVLCFADSVINNFKAN